MDDEDYGDEDEYDEDDEADVFVCDICGDPITDQDTVPVGIEIIGFTVDEYEMSKEYEKQILCCIDCFKIKTDAIMKRLEDEDGYESV